MDELTISLLEKKDIPEAARVLSLAMLKNPIHVAVFQGQDEEARRGIERIQKNILLDYPGIVFVGKIEGQIVSVFRMSSCHSHLISNENKEKAKPRSPLLHQYFMNMGKILMKAGGKIMSVGKNLSNRSVYKDKTWRVSFWHKTWDAHDPPEPHWHYGPGGVLPSFHGTGIGTAHMKRICQEIDACKSAGYLETDLLENVRFYQKFDFKVIKEIEIFGVKNYLMWRSPKQR